MNTPIPSSGFTGRHRPQKPPLLLRIPLTKTLYPTLIVPLAILFCSCSTQELTRDSASQTIPVPAQSSWTTAQADTHFVMVGDSIVFSVWGYPEFTTRAIVKKSGTISVPLVGEITAAGRTRGDLRQYLRQRLGEFIQGEVRMTIDIISPLPQIMVIGAVLKQGSFPAGTDLSLLEVLSIAGGWTEQSDLRHVKISFQKMAGRDGGTNEVDVDWYLETGNLRSVPVVHPGDVVYVPTKENAVREVADYLRDVFLLFGFFRLLY